MSISRETILQGDVADSTDLSDFNQSGLAENDILMRNGSNEWVNSTTLPAAAIASDSISFDMMVDATGEEKLVGRGEGSGGGTLGEITLGTNLSMTSGVLNAAGASGDTVTVNGSALSGTQVDFDDATPGAQGAGVNVLWQKDASDPDNVSAYVAEGAVSNALIRDSAALSVIGRSANSSGDVADIAGTDGQALRVSGTTLGFGTLASAAYAAESVTYEKLEHSAGFDVIGKSSTGAGDPASIAAGDETVLGRTGGGDLGFAALATGQVAANAIEYAKWQQLAGFSIPAKAGTGTGNAADLTAGSDSVLGRVASGDLAFGKVALSQQADIVQARLLGRGGASGTGAPELLTIGSGLSMAGTELSATGGAGDYVEVNAVGTTDGANFNNTVPAAVGNGVNVLFQRSGTSPDSVSAYMAAGSIDTDMLGASAATYAKIQDVSATDRLLGRGTAGAGVIEEITLDSSLTLTATDLAVTNPSSAGLSGYVMNASSVIVADHTDRVVNGNARGANSVDLQTERAGVAEVAAAANSVICGGKNNQIGSTSQYGAIQGGLDNTISDAGLGHVVGGGNTNAISGASTSWGVIAGGSTNTVTAARGAVGGGVYNNVDQADGTIAGGKQATTVRFGEVACGGGTAAEAQKVQNVASALTTDATLTTMGYTNALADWTAPAIDTATIPFPAAGTYVLSVEGTVVGMRAETSDTAACFKIAFAVKKNSGGTVSFVGNPKVSVVGRDNAALDCDVVLAATNGGVDVKVTGIAAQTFCWACEWEGAEIKVPAL